MNADAQCFVSTTCKITSRDEKSDEEKINEFAQLISSLCDETIVYVYKIRANENFYNVMATLEACKDTPIYKKK